MRNKAESEQFARGRPRSLRSILQEAHEQIEQGGGIPHDQFWQEVEKSRAAKQPGSGRDKKVRSPRKKA